MARSKFSHVVMPIVRAELTRAWHDSEKTQQAVADLLGVSLGQLQRYVSGKRRPGVEAGIVFLARLNPTKAISVLTQVRDKIGGGTLVMVALNLCPGLATLEL